MKKISTLLALLVITASLHAQSVHVFITGGLVNYQGDLQGRRITLQQAHPFGGAGLYYEFTDKLSFRLGVFAGKISAHDKYSPTNKNRNLSFESQLIELHLGAEYDILNAYEHTIAPYIFAGVAAYHFNPYAYNLSNVKVFLQPLGTEGQGFYNGRKKYSLTQMAIPFGGGLKLVVNDKITIRGEAVLRLLFTDYLDDVSTTLAPGADLIANNGQQAFDMAFRAPEINPAAVYVATLKRGNPTTKDYYYTAGISLAIRLGGDGGGSKKPGKNKLGCPVNVY